MYNHNKRYRSYHVNIVVFQRYSHTYPKGRQHGRTLFRLKIISMISNVIYSSHFYQVFQNPLCLMQGTWSSETERLEMKHSKDRRDLGKSRASSYLPFSTVSISVRCTLSFSLSAPSFLYFILNCCLSLSFSLTLNLSIL